MPTDILIVEDSPTQAALLAETLRVRGYQTKTAANGKEALESLRRRRPDVVISDVKMPRMDGFQLCRTIKQDPDLHHLPVILLTSLSQPADLLSALEAGADFHLPKPYQGDYLAAKITELLSSYRNGGGPLTETGPPIAFDGTDYQISVPREQVFRLLLSTYEVANQQHQEVLRRLEKEKEMVQALNEKADQLACANA